MSILLTIITLMGTSGRIHKGKIWVYWNQTKSYKKAGRIEGPGRFRIIKKGGRCQNARWYKLASGHWVCSPYFVVTKKPWGKLRNWVPYMYNRQYFMGTGKVSSLGSSLKAIRNNQWRTLTQLRGFLPVKRLLIGEEPYVKLVTGAYLSSRSIKPYTPSKLLGLTATAKDFPVAFVIRKNAWLYKRSGKGFARWRKIRRYSVRPVRKRKRGWYYVRYAPFAHLRAGDLAVAPRVPQMPSGVGKRETWVHADLSAKVMVAMRGKKPLRVMLFAAGPNTLTGNHRIFLKRVYQHYDLVHSTDGYYLEAVPYVLYYNKGFAIHAAYWHDNFPNHKTHGCINLSVKDARWLFTLLGPKTPRGYIQIRSRKNRGGLVVITK